MPLSRTDQARRPALPLTAQDRQAPVFHSGAENIATPVPAQQAYQRLDLAGLKCPLPALKTEAALAALAIKEILRVETTDPLAVLDVPNVIRQTGNVLVSMQTAGGLTTFVIQKA